MHYVKGNTIVKLILFLCFLGVVFIFFIQESLRTDVVDLFENIKVNIANVEREFFPKRKRPFTITRQQTELKLLLPDPFVNLSREDWNEFWNLIYGNSGYDIPDNPRLSYRRRQYTFKEIEQILQTRYKVFERFQNQHWEEFWRITLKKKKFQRQ